MADQNTQRDTQRDDSDMSPVIAVVALVATAIVSGGFVGLVAASYIWLFESGIDFVWEELPERVGVDPFESWWIIVVPVVGGVLVGVLRRLLGPVPGPLEEAITTWKSGGQIPPDVAPRTGVNAFVCLVFGGPVGFEAALVGVLGGTATFVGRWIRGAGRLIRQVFGAERVEGLPHRLRQMPYWLAAIAGLLVFRWVPFGGVDMGFRFDVGPGSLGVGEGLLIFGFAAVVTVPTVIAFGVVRRAEHADAFGRSPIVMAVFGALMFALLATVNELVLFSGQQGFQLLPTMGNLDLLYVAVAKWAALVIALACGWRGGPIFPLFTSVAALGVIVADPFDVDPGLLMVAGVAAVSTTLTKGSIVLGFVLSLYVAPLAYAAPVLIGAVGAMTALSIAQATGMLPVSAEPEEVADDAA